MITPWLDIPLADYEGHMAFPTVGQASMLADEFEAALKAHQPRAAAIAGCAGGNGFERAKAVGVTRLVGIDVNAAYLAEASRRHADTIPGLELYHADLQGEWPAIRPVDLVYAALVFEYVDVAAALRNLRTLCRPGGVLVTLLQMPSPTQHAVSPSPFSRVGAVASILRLVPPASLNAQAEAGGFTCESARTVELPSGKQFTVQTFRRSPARAGHA